MAVGEAGVKREPEPVAQAPEKAETGVDIKTEPQPTMEASTPNPPAPSTEPTQPNEPDQPVKVERPEETPAMADQPTAPTTETKVETGLNETGGSGVNDFDLHLDFGDDEIGNQNFLNMNTGGGTNETIAADSSGAGNIPAGGDAFDLEFQKADVQQQQRQPSQSQTDSQTGEQTEDVMAPGESSFDDLFMGSGEMGDQGLLEGDELMNINELDDNWFT